MVLSHSMYVRVDGLSLNVFCPLPLVLLFISVAST